MKTALISNSKIGSRSIRIGIFQPANIISTANQVIGKLTRVSGHAIDWKQYIENHKSAVRYKM